MTVKAQPDEYHTLTRYLRMRGAAGAIDFYKRVFGAEEMMRMPGPDGKSVMHAELKIGDSVLMLGEPMGGEALGSSASSSGQLLYVQDVDRAFKKATDAGASVKEPLQTMFYGDRMGVVTDPYGHEWMLATHVEDVSDAEMKKRMAAQNEKMAASARA